MSKRAPIRKSAKGLNFSPRDKNNKRAICLKISHRALDELDRRSTRRNLTRSAYISELFEHMKEL